MNSDNRQQGIFDVFTSFRPRNVSPYQLPSYAFPRSSRLSWSMYQVPHLRAVDVVLCMYFSCTPYDLTRRDGPTLTTQESCMSDITDNSWMGHLYAHERGAHSVPNNEFEKVEVKPATNRPLLRYVFPLPSAQFLPLLYA